MQKISNYLCSISPKKLAIYLLIYPLPLIVFHTIITIISRNSEVLPSIFIDGFLATLLIIGLAILLHWFLWFPTTLYGVSREQLGISKKWFRIAFFVFVLFLVYNLVTIILQSKLADENLIYIYATRETVNFIGIMVAYPTICHFSARAIFNIKNNKDATFFSALPLSLLLIFIPICIPYFHKYFSIQKSTNKEILKIYLIAFSICILLFVGAFFAAITGLL
jgi:hypothetical protein